MSLALFARRKDRYIIITKQIFIMFFFKYFELGRILIIGYAGHGAYSQKIMHKQLFCY